MTRLGLFVVIGMLAASPAAGDSLLEALAPCAKTTDRPICVLKALAAKDGGSMIWRDPDLASQQVVTSALGLSAEGVAAARGMSQGEQIFFGAADEAQAAVEDARRLDAAGRPPAEALAPILDLSTASPPIPPFFMSMDYELSSPRAEAYQRLLIDPQLAKGPPSRLAVAAADVWERDIASPTTSAAFKDSAHWLVAARAALRDELGARRALALIPSPVRRIEAMTQLGWLEEAVQAAADLRRADVVAFTRVKMARFVEQAVRAQQAAARQIAATMPDEVRRMGLDDNPEIAKRLRQMQAEAARPAPMPRIPASEIEEAADNSIASMEESLLRAGIRKDRLEAVRPLADRLLQKAELTVNRYRFPLVVKAATPAATVARLEALEATLSPTKGAELLEPLVNAWVQIGRTDRADALVDRAASWARASGARKRSPYAFNASRLLWARNRQAEATAIFPLRSDDKLKLDIEAGRGLAAYDSYLAETPENERTSLTIRCDSAAEEAKAWPIVLSCIERRRLLFTEPFRRALTAGTAFERAGGAAEAGDLTTARRLFQIGAEEAAAAVAADSKVGDTYDVGSWGSIRLLAYAKAELRADGRLPKSASPGMQ